MVHLFHGSHLSSGADSADRQANIDSRSDALVEQLCLQEDLAVGDGDDVGWDVGRDVAGLCLNDRQCGQGSASELVVHLGRTLQQSTVQVEHITRIRLTARRSTQQQRHLSVCHRLNTTAQQ